MQERDQEQHPPLAPSVQEQEELATAQHLKAQANQLYEQGHYQQATCLLQQVLTLYERHLGPEHPDTACQISDLALLYQLQGQYEAALVLHQQALDLYERC